MKLHVWVAAGVLLSFSAFAAELVIDQKDKQFSKKAVKVKVGDSIEPVRNFVCEA